MAHGPVPLLHTEPPNRPVARETGLRLTDTGAQVLAGGADHVTLNGVDRWIGGVQRGGTQEVARRFQPVAGAIGLHQFKARRTQFAANRIVSLPKVS